MVLRRSSRRVNFSLSVALVALLFLLVACGSSSTNHNSSGSSSTSKTSTSSSNSASAAATATAYEKLVSLIGQPKVKMLTGTTFEAVGQIKNVDAFQHDITLQVVLTDASGKVIANGSQFLDNVKPGATVSYAVKGTTTQPAWTS